MEVSVFQKVAYIFAVPDFRTRAGAGGSQAGKGHSGILHRAT